MVVTGVILTAPTARGPDGTSKTTFLHEKMWKEDILCLCLCFTDQI